MLHNPNTQAQRATFPECLMKTNLQNPWKKYSYYWYTCLTFAAPWRNANPGLDWRINCQIRLSHWFQDQWFSTRNFLPSLHKLEWWQPDKRKRKQLKSRHCSFAPAKPLGAWHCRYPTLLQGTCAWHRGVRNKLAGPELLQDPLQAGGARWTGGTAKPWTLFLQLFKGKRTSRLFHTTQWEDGALG